MGVSHECDFPADVVGLPVLSRPKMDPTLPGDVIDQDVRELVRRGLSVYEVDTDTLEELRPDVIVTQDHCEVCAVSLRDIEQATCSITLKDTTVCSLSPTDLTQICGDLMRVADAAGVPERGLPLVKSFRSQLAQIRAATEDHAKPTVACIEWLEPPMIAAGWFSELVEIAGGAPVVVHPAGEKPSRRPTADKTKRQFSTVAWPDIAALDPDVVVVVPCGYAVDETLSDLSKPDVADGLRSLRAVSDGRCFVADGNAYFNRPGPRLADSARLLGHLLHPDSVSADGLIDRAFETWR